MPRPYNPKDKYFQQAKQQGYRARSVFKLTEIQERFHLIRRGDKVLDLGAAPGSFLQSLSEIAGEKGQVIGIDLQEIINLNLPNVRTFQADIFNEPELDRIFYQVRISRFDAITADLAPKTTGIKDVDQYRSFELNEQVLQIAPKYLKPGGNLITKIFIGEEFNNFLKNMKQHFIKVSSYKPQACRDRSYETYLIGRGYQNGFKKPKDLKIKNI